MDYDYFAAEASDLQRASIQRTVEKQRLELWCSTLLEELTVPSILFIRKVKSFKIES